METVVVSLIIITLVLFGAMALARHYFHSQDVIASSWHAMAERSEQRSQSDLSIIDTDVQDDTVDISIRNVGDVRLADFDRCDLIVHYYSASSSYQITWLPHESIAEGTTCWSVLGIYSEAASLEPEVYEPNILNPTEEMVVEATLSASVEPSSTLMAVFNDPQGAKASVIFENN